MYKVINLNYLKSDKTEIELIRMILWLNNNYKFNYVAYIREDSRVRER